ncbi:hypothetical protein [Phenylobacterium sp.]|uniref:hypothetical protein n=1 Tax=Phenylobacterium sp. TaxID=1871053 RepID=UPI0019AF8FA8|nr:hypothetical protein [Phenylobacterium sp.]MBC7168088.1 hypothetical protein [Phenylobacterium sp.]
MAHIDLRAPALALVLALGACGQEDGELDEATIDAGAMRTPPNTQASPRTPTTIANGTTVYATEMARELQAFLESGEPAPREFELTAISFVQGVQVREDPDGTIANLVTILNAHPQARVQIVVPHTNPQSDRVSEASEDRAARVAQVFVENGLDPARITSAGRNAPAEVVPHAVLVVTQK